MTNWKAILFILAFGQGMVLSFALIVRGLRGLGAGMFLGMILYVLSIEMLNAWGMQVRFHSAPGAFPFWIFQSYLILPVSLWFFMQFTTLSTYIFRQRYWLFFLPVGFEICISLIWRVYWRYQDKRVPSLLENPVWFFVTELLPIIGMVVVLGIYAKRLVGLHSRFSRQGVRLRALQLLKIYGLFTFLTILTGLWVAGVILDLPVFSIIELFLSVCLFALGYAGYLDPDFFNLPSIPRKVQEKTEFGIYSDTIELARLKAAFQQDKLFIQSKLTIDDVATCLHLPNRYVSHLINTYCDSNFSTFVNEYRVQEVIRKLGDPKEQYKTILALALESGFSSKSNFNQVFKQHTGKSPSQFSKSENRPEEKLLEGK